MKFGLFLKNIKILKKFKRLKLEVFRLKFLINNLNIVKSYVFELKLHLLLKKYTLTKYVVRCILLNRQKSVLTDFRLSRVAIKNCYENSELNGVRKSS